jgi:hypothetical protein
MNYKIKNLKDVDVSKRNGAKLYANQLEKYGSTDAYINRREITKRFILPPGDYLIIPSCYDYGHQGEFLLRIFSEKAIEEQNTLILTEDKKKLSDEEIYFLKNVTTDQSFSSWVDLLSSGDDTKPVERPVSSRGNFSSPTGASSISNLVRSAFTTNIDKEDNHDNLKVDFDVRKVVAKFENKKTVQDNCNIM